MSGRSPWLACLVAGALAAAGGAAAAGGTAAVAPCATTKLVVWLDTQGNGAAGSIYYDLEFTNLSGRACTLRGFPGVSAVSLTGRQIGRAASRNPPGLRTVRLANGRTAHAVLRIVEAANFPQARCHRRTAAGLRVYPPGSRLSKIVPFPLQACAATGVSVLDVSAVEGGFR